MSLKDDVRWARPEQLWAEIYTGQDPRCVRVLPVTALRKWIQEQPHSAERTVFDLLAELEGL
ncbi:MAG: hypothetical protein K2Y05_10510 [Hyphomicrobiaceae bacterium]|nr:hypothetical protein [Hyphomicrobiaceae bacterium]